MPIRNFLAFAFAGAALIISGCGHEPAAHDPNTDIAKVRATIQRLGGDPDRVYRETVLTKGVNKQPYNPRTSYLVPSRDGRQFQIVDEEGVVYPDYDEFVVRNQLGP